MQNLFTADDAEGVFAFGAPSAESDFFKKGDKGFEKYIKYLNQMVDLSAKLEKNMTKALGATTGNPKGSTSGTMGLGQFTRTEKIVGAASAVAGIVGIGMGMMPSTKSAVELQQSADAYAGMSGMSSQSAILRANKAVGNGVTSALGPTQAAMTLAYSGGYLANSISSKNVMSQIGGLSALTGGTNQQVAQGMAGINGMSFLRIGVKVRDANGNLKPPNQIINDTWNFLYGGRQITKEQAAMVMNPGSKGYITIQQITGGDPNLMNIIQMGIMARAGNGDKSISSSQLQGSSQALNLLGVSGKSSLRSQFNLNTAGANLLAQTNQGLVQGYNTSNNTAAAIDNGLAGMAKQLPVVADLLGRLKGVLETFPGATNASGTISGLAGGAMSMGYGALQNRALSQMISSQQTVSQDEVAASAVARAGKLARAARGLGYAGSILSGGLQGYASGQSTHKFSWGSLLSSAGQGFATGGMMGLIAGSETGPGALLTGLIGGVLGAGANVAGQLFGGGGTTTQPMSTGESGHGAIHSPAPKAPITSGFGMRTDPMNPKKKNFHSGIDYGVKVGTPVSAAGPGKVTHTGTDKDYGNYVIVTHGKKSTLYAHLSQILVRPGQQVTSKTIIGKSGGKKGAPGSGRSTGAHLHFELRDNGGVGAAGRVDPKKYMGSNSALAPSVTSNSSVVPSASSSGTHFVGKHYSNSVGINSISDPSILSSTPLPAVLGSAMVAGSPTNYSDWISRLSKKQVSTLQATDGTSLVNSSPDFTAHGIPGGNAASYMKMLYAQGFRGRALQTAFAVSMAESHGNPSAHGDINLQDAKWGPSIGLFQIRSLKDWKKYDNPNRDGSRLNNPKYNIQAAWNISHGGKNWKPWSTYTGGEYVRYLDDAARAAQADGFGVGGPSSQGMSLNPGYGHGPGSNQSFSSNSSSQSHVNIKVQMNVNIASANAEGVQKMVTTFNDQLYKQLRIKGISQGL